MKAHLAQSSENYKKLKVSLAIIIVIFFLSGCAKTAVANNVLLNQSNNYAYFSVIDKVMPTYNVETSNRQVFYNLEKNAISEAYDVQADGALNTGVAKYWYPHYQSTVVIAIDRDLTDVKISGWKDLTSIEEVVGISRDTENMQMIMAAMSYGLEGRNYSFNKSLTLLSALEDEDRLVVDSTDSPVTIGFDSEIEKDQNTEIVIPSEGTITYEKGLLSNKRIIFPRKLNQLLLENNLKSVDDDLYSSAIKVKDFQHFNEVTKNTQRVLEREVLGKKLFMTINHQEHIFVAIIFIIVTTIWVTTIVRRSMQKGIVYSAVLTGVLVNSWTLLRLIKYQAVVSPVLNRYLWFSFYIFQLSLPVVLMWMAYSIDKPKSKKTFPKWFKIISLLSIFLIILVFTNDFHGIVFELDFSKVDWNTNYTYGWGYYLILIFSMINLLIVFILLLYKSSRNPEKRTFVFPLILFVLFAIYNYKYIVRDPIIYETDVTIITGLFVLLMLEACMRSGLIPVNTKYIGLFRKSPLMIQITDNYGEVIISSNLAVPVDDEIIDTLLTYSPTPYFLDDQSLLFANKIPGGYVIWKEDVKKVYQLHKEIKEANKLLNEANSMLTKEKELKRHVNEKEAKQELMNQLETEISTSVQFLSTMIEALPENKNYNQSVTQIALLLSYIKRRSNLFFKEKELDLISFDELVIYIDELAEVTKYANLDIISVNSAVAQINIRQATLFYQVFYEIVFLAISLNNKHIIEQFYSEAGHLIMSFLLSEDFREFKIKRSLYDEIIKAQGQVMYKDLGDTISISVSFLKRGVKDD